MNKLLTLISAVFLATSFSYGQTPKTARDYLILSQSHFQEGDFDVALKEVDKAIELNPNYVDAFMVRAMINHKKGDKESVLGDYNKIIELDLPGQYTAVVYTNRSSLFLEKGETDKALADLDKAVSLKPKEPLIYIARAVARTVNGETGGALADYEKSIELGTKVYAAFMGRGSIRFSDGDFDGALTDYEKALQLSPKTADLYIGRGIARGMKNDFTGAVADIKKGAELDSKSITDDSRGNFRSPFTELDQFIDKYPKNAEAYLLRGVFRKLQRKSSEAETDFNKCLQLSPELQPEVIKILLSLN